MPVTLLGLTRLPDTPTPPLRLLRTATQSATTMAAMTIAPTPLNLAIGSPDCYETPVGGLWCLGMIRNDLPMPIEQVIVRVYLVTADGTALAQQETSIARSALPPGAVSPYGVLFDRVPTNSAGPVVTLISAIEAYNLGSRLIPISVENVQTDLDNPAFHVTGNLTNRASMPIRDLNLIITLFDAAGRVTGFRQWRWPPNQVLVKGGSMPFAVDVIPQGRGTLRVETYADGGPD